MEVDFSAARKKQESDMLTTTVHHAELSRRQKVYTGLALDYAAKVAIYGSASVEEVIADISEQLSERGANEVQIGKAVQAAIEYLENIAEIESNL